MKKFGFGNLGSPLAVLLLLSLFVLGCRKDGLLTTDESPGLQQNREKISINEARQFFENQYSAFSGFSDSAYAMVKVEPDWDWAFISHSISGNEIAVVPLKDTLLRHMNEGRAGAKLIFQKIGGDSILANVLVYCADSAYYAAYAGSMQFENFTGSYLFFDIGMNFEHGVYVENGSPLGRVMSLSAGSGGSTASLDRINCFTRLVTIHHPCYVPIAFDEGWCHSVITVVWCVNDDGGITDPIIPYLPPMPGGGGGAGGGQGNPPSGGGSGGNNPPVEIPFQAFWDIFLGNTPVDALLNFGDELPSGEWENNVELMQQFQQIQQGNGFSPNQLRWLAQNTSFIYVIHQAMGAGNDPDVIKNVLTFSINTGLNADQFLFFVQNQTTFQTAKQFSEAHGNDQTSQLALRLVTDLSIHNQFPLNVNSQVLHQILSDYPELSDEDVSGPIVEMWVAACAIEAAKLRHQYPGWPDWRVYAEAVYNVSIEGIHLALDGIGLFPVVGEWADLTSGALYYMEGNWQDGTLAVASAVPFVGWASTSAKYAKKVVNAGGRKCTLWWDATSSVINFGDRNQLKRIIKPASGYVAHHLIPWQFCDHDLVQLAAMANGPHPWHMNDFINGLGVASSRHPGSHPNYSNAVLSKLEDIMEENPNISPDIARDKLENLAVSIKNILNQHPNLGVNDPYIAQLIVQLQI
jgi:hypothetical protein